MLCDGGGVLSTNEYKGRTDSNTPSGPNETVRVEEEEKEEKKEENKNKKKEVIKGRMEMRKGRRRRRRRRRKMGGCNRKHIGLR